MSSADELKKKCSMCIETAKAVEQIRCTTEDLVRAWKEVAARLEGSGCTPRRTGKARRAQKKKQRLAKGGPFHTEHGPVDDNGWALVDDSAQGRATGNPAEHVSPSD